MNVLKTVNIVIGLVLVALLMFAGSYLEKLLNQGGGQTDKYVPMKTASPCDLNSQTCMANIEQRSVRLRFKQTVKYLTRFDVEVVTDGFASSEIESMSVDFSMLDMTMGINRFSLKRTDKKDVWQGMAILPVCITGRSDWRVKLYLANSQTDYIAIFNLEVEK